MAKAQTARVTVDEARWLAFRQAALARGILGRLVEAELKHREGRAVATIAPEMPVQDQAIAALAEIRASIDELEDPARRLARSAIAHGGSWDDVAGSLRLEPEQARVGLREIAAACARTREQRSAKPRDPRLTKF